MHLSLQEAEDFWRGIPVDAESSAHDFFERLLANLEASAQAMKRSYLMLVGLSAAYLFLYSGEVNEVNLSWLQIKNRDTLLWVIPTLMAVVYYYAISSIAIYIGTLRLSHAYYEIHLPQVHTAGLTGLAAPISFLSFEVFVAAKEGSGSRLASAVGTLIMMACIVAPWVIIPVFAWLNLRELLDLASFLRPLLLKPILLLVLSLAMLRCLLAFHSWGEELRLREEMKLSATVDADNEAQESADIADPQVSG